MRILTLVFALIVAAPVLCADNRDADLIGTVLEYHFARTQPFFRGAAIVSSRSHAAPEDEVMMIEQIVKDARIADQLAASPARNVVDLTASGPGYVVGEIPRSAPTGELNWKEAAERFPHANVAFEVSTPRLTNDESYAVVRIDGTPLRGNNAGRPFSILYSASRSVAGKWTIASFVAPCCARPGR